MIPSAAIAAHDQGNPDGLNHDLLDEGITMIEMHNQPHKSWQSFII
jgi:hypothetical protein